MDDKELSRVLSEEMKKTAVPDVWDRIEKKLDEGEDPAGVYNSAPVRKNHRLIYAAAAVLCVLAVIPGAVFAAVSIRNSEAEITQGTVLPQSEEALPDEAELSDSGESSVITKDLFKGFALSKKSAEEIKKVVADYDPENNTVYESEDSLYIVSSAGELAAVAKVEETSSDEKPEIVDEYGIRRRVAALFANFFPDEDIVYYSYKINYTGQWNVTASRKESGIITRQIKFVFNDYGELERLSSPPGVAAVGKIGIAQAAEAAVARANEPECGFAPFRKDTPGVNVLIENRKIDNVDYYEVEITCIPTAAGDEGSIKLLVNAETGEVI